MSFANAPNFHYSPDQKRIDDARVLALGAGLLMQMNWQTRQMEPRATYFASTRSRLVEQRGEDGQVLYEFEGGVVDQAEARQEYLAQSEIGEAVDGEVATVL